MLIRIARLIGLRLALSIEHGAQRILSSTGGEKEEFSLNVFENFIYVEELG